MAERSRWFGELDLDPTSSSALTLDNVERVLESLRPTWGDREASSASVGPGPSAEFYVQHSVEQSLNVNLSQDGDFYLVEHPTSGSWLNMVEIWFGIIERQAIRRGSFTSVADLIAKIRAFINGWNPRAHPFIWTKPADQILDKINRKRISTTSH